jgi:hypothetical protein
MTRLKRAIVHMPDKAMNERLIASTGYKAPVVATYGSFTEFLADAAEIPRKFPRYAAEFGSSFGGNVDTWDHAIELARKGSQESGDQAVALMNELSEQGLFSVGPSQLGLDVVGMVPCVPAYLSGHPESMLTRVEGVGMTTPLRVYAGIGAGGYVTGEQLIARGVAITAFVLAMSAIRPVELYAFTHTAAVESGQWNSPDSDHAMVVWPVATRPVDLTSVAHQLCHPSMHRVFGFTFSDVLHDRHGGRPIPCGGSRDKIEQHARAMFNADAGDMVIPRATHGPDDPLISNPTAWLKEVLATHMAEYMPV